MEAGDGGNIAYDFHSETASWWAVLPQKAGKSIQRNQRRILLCSFWESTKSLSTLGDINWKMLSDFRLAP